MRWFKKYSNDSPRLISLSPLRHSDQQDGSILSYYSNRSGNNENENIGSSASLPQTPVVVNKNRNGCTTSTLCSTSSATSAAIANTVDLPIINSTATNTLNLRKSRIDTPTTITFGKKRSHRSPNCYNIQEGKIIERPTTRPNRYISPIRIKNKNLRSPLLSATVNSTTCITSNPIETVTNTSNTNTPVATEKLRRRSDVDNTFCEQFDASPHSLNSFQKSKLTPSSHGPIWDFDKAINSVECAKIGTISYREKRNPLASTRLSCYKPKITDNYSLPHYKSVDDFLFLNSNSDDIASNSSSSTSEYSSDHRTDLIDINANSDLIENQQKPKLTKENINTSSSHLQNEDDELLVDDKTFALLKQNGNRRQFDETYGFTTTITTKSVENIFEPKLYTLASNPKKIRKDLNMANFSEKIKCMSSRTQKLFSKIYNNNSNSQSNSCGKQQQQPQITITANGVVVLPNDDENKTVKDAATGKVSKSRRSLSYGNLPGLDDFRHTLKHFNKSKSGSSSKKNDDIREDESDESLAQNVHKLTINVNQNQTVKDDLLVGGEDTDSGILVNESGQSSIIETDYLLHPDHHHIDNGNNRMQKKMPSNATSNQDFEFKFVRLCIEEDDQDRCLGFGVKAIRSEMMSKCVGYQVATILPGGIVDKDGTIRIGDEIVNIFGRCLRGLSMLQVQELLSDSTKGTNRCEIDLVICRYATNSNEKLRKKSIDSLLNTDDGGATSFERSYNEYASTALKIDGNKYNTLGTRRNKTYLSVVRPLGDHFDIHTSDVPASLNTTIPTSPVKKRAAQFQKNHSSYSSMSNKLFRRSLIGKQQQQQQQNRNLNSTETNSELINNGEPQLTLVENEQITTNDDQPCEFIFNTDLAPISNYKKLLAKSSYNLCDDEKLSLSLIASNQGENLIRSGANNRMDTIKMHKQSTIIESGAGNYCTLPRRPKSGLCSFHTVIYEKGPGKKKLGFTVVGGTDTGAIGIFIKSILPTGQAAEDERLKAGDEILAVNGQVCHDLSHEEAVKLFKSVKCGEIALHVCRRMKINKIENVRETT